MKRLRNGSYGQKTAIVSKAWQSFFRFFARQILCIVQLSYISLSWHRCHTTICS